MLTKIKQLAYTKIVQDCVSDFGHSAMETSRKKDGSLVTSADIKISEKLKELLLSDDQLTGFFSEEEEDRSLSFPSYILDPIDGTSGFVKGNNEWVVSLAYMNSDKINDEKNCGIVFNPFEKLWLDSWSERAFKAVKRDYLLGSLSRSDFTEKEASALCKSQIRLVQKGSIALKLGLLAMGDYDFVYSKSDKSLWDVASGTIICHRSGHGLYNKHGRVEYFKEERLEGPMLWCQENDFERLRYLLENDR